MTIVVDASPAVHQRAGIGRYVQELITALLENEPPLPLTLFYNRAAKAAPTPPLDRLPRLAIPSADKPWRLRVMLAHGLQRPQHRLFPQVTLFHATDHLAPYLPGVPIVFTLHDLTHRLYPQTQTTLNRLYLHLMLGRFLDAACAVIAVSESTRRDAIRLYGLDPHKVHAIPLGVHTRFCPAPSSDILAIRRKMALPDRFILYLGTLEPRKNLTSLLLALADLPDVPLVIAGKAGWLTQTIDRQIESLGLRGRVTLLGYTPEADLPALFSAARAFVFPSLYEGFGLPPLEAMACGTPVICSNAASLPEVVAEAGLLAPPQEPRALREAIRLLWDDNALWGEYRARGLRRAAQFTWQRTAAATLAVYHQALQL